MRQYMGEERVTPAHPKLVRKYEYSKFRSVALSFGRSKKLREVDETVTFSG